VLACTSSSAPNRMRPRRGTRKRESKRRLFIDDESNPGNGRPFLPSGFSLRRAAAPGNLASSFPGAVSCRRVRGLFLPGTGGLPPDATRAPRRRLSEGDRSPRQHHQAPAGARSSQVAAATVRCSARRFCSAGGLLGASRTTIGQRRLSREQERTQRCRYRTQRDGAGNIGVCFYFLANIFSILNCSSF
jgi:hypothetical protein